MHLLTDISRQYITGKMYIIRLLPISCKPGKLYKSIGNEKGAVLVIALMLLAVLTVLGVAALNTTTTEIRISGNEKVYKQAFYTAEAGIAYALERGVAFFPENQVGAVVAIPADLAAAAPGVTLASTDFGGSPRRVEVRATGTVAGGGVSTIVAGLISVLTGKQQGSSNSPLESSYTGFGKNINHFGKFL